MSRAIPAITPAQRRVLGLIRDDIPGFGPLQWRTVRLLGERGLWIWDHGRKCGRALTAVGAQALEKSK